ncbi:MAG: leucyl aminopeptidase family protein [Alphaproteobacteria bacterium]|nr:leucyl aminopeptidase family protein [Alphaproteobacteria bacterium]
MQLTNKKTAQSIPVTPVAASNFNAWLKKQSKSVQTAVKAQGFTGSAGSTMHVTNAKGATTRILYGTGHENGLYTFSALPARLQSGTYYLDSAFKGNGTDAALGWALGTYDFTRYKSGKNDKKNAQLVWPKGADKKYVTATAEAWFMVRDLINTPPNNMQPNDLQKEVAKLAKKHKATVKTIKGKALLEKNYPTIYTVGKAGEHPPQLIDLHWGKTTHPKVTLVGKGVTFDTGGLNIKPGGNMSLMKKDMGGAAHVIGLAHMIMSAKLPVRLRVLIPAVENSISDESYRPSDVITTRKGITVEIDNTDAEGRLILCDALAEASREKPELIMDFATLTGAARVALGPELVPIFTHDDKVMSAIEKGAKETEDHVWRMPLWAPYLSMLDSKVADIKNSGGGFAGATTAALFLEKFVDKNIPWVHIDTYGWNPTPRPGRPLGGEAYGIRASFEMIKKLFGKGK